MSNESQINKLTIDNLKERVEKLEQQEENSYKQIIENNKQLSIIVVELKSITKSMENLAESWKNAIDHTEEKREMEKNQITDKIKTLEKTVSDLKQTVDSRTIEKNSKMFDNIKWIIISGIVSSVLTSIFS